jgi:hypothetical protein
MQDKSLLVFLRVEVTEIAGAPRKKWSIESIDTSRCVRLSSACGERGPGGPAAWRGSGPVASQWPGAGAASQRPPSGLASGS